MKLSIELSGGLELLFKKQKFFNLEWEDKETISLRELLQWMKTNLIQERPELFIIEGSVRPGILVLINDCDWELMGGIDCMVQDNDNVVFISTLHGG